MNSIKVDNCQDCPFCNQDNEFGNDACNVKEISLKDFEQLPNNKVHDDCPLKEMDFSVTLNK